jgi:hypothetical protein
MLELQSYFLIIFLFSNVIQGFVEPYAGNFKFTKSYFKFLDVFVENFFGNFFAL